MSPTKSNSRSRTAKQATVGKAAKPLGPAPLAAQPAEEHRRPGILLLILIPLLMLGSFWIGRLTPQAPASGSASTPAPDMATSASAAPQTAAAPKAAVTNPHGTAASTVRPGPETTLQEVSVGTTSRGGLTLRFDHPVDWKAAGTTGGAQAELEVRGVRALGTFPRNLPLPPGVTAIHAGTTAPDTLNLKFNLQPGIRMVTVPVVGPAAALNIYFRNPAEEALAPSSPASVCGVETSPETAKAMTLLQSSLDKNPGYAAVRQALALLVTCSGDSAKAEQLLADGAKSGADNGVKLAVTDAALRYARGDIDGALKSLKNGAPAGAADPDYLELVADLQAARQP